jgi:hypothetical protein
MDVLQYYIPGVKSQSFPHYKTQMNPEIRINTINISKIGNTEYFLKYDMEVALEEIENTDSKTKVKYEFTLLSNPKNTRINVEGTALIHGNQSEVLRFLEQDKNHIPRILHSIYQEIFPLLYTNSLAMQIPCPSYKLAQISSPAQTTETIQNEEPVLDQLTTSDGLPTNETEPNYINNVEEHQKTEIEIPTS